MKKVVLGLSGGVDSAVSTRLLQNAGYEVHGLFLDIGNPASRADAEAAAASLGVELTIADVAAELEREVCAPFAASYLRGETPNPCILCNPAVKFRRLCDRADALGADYIATGHYARVKDGKLLCALSSKDQSYMLCRLRPEQVRRLILPLGEFEKTHTRELAAEFGLPVANKPDSMEICFIPDKDYAAWLSRRGALPEPGEFVWNGTPVGRHEGIHRWTVGQRIPGVYDGAALYVVGLRPETREVLVDRNEALMRREFTARDFNWLIDAPDAPVPGAVKVRHSRGDGAPCTAEALGGGRVRFTVPDAVRAPAPGQSAVLYSGDQVLGGGFIE